MSRPRAKLFLGIAASGGVQEGEGFVLSSHHTHNFVSIAPNIPRTAFEEGRRLDVALTSALDTLLPHREKLSKHTVGRELYDAHLLMLSDPVFHKQAQDLIATQSATAEAAVQRLIQDWKAKLGKAQDRYLRGRTDDFNFVEQTLLSHLAHGIRPTNALPFGAILFAQTLGPVDIALLEHHRVRAVVLEEGGVTAHAAIVARALGIPAVMGVSSIVRKVCHREWVTVDGNRGSVSLGGLRAKNKKSVAPRVQTTHQSYSSSLAIPIPKVQTQDGVEIEVFAAVDQVARAKEVFASGSCGIGLLRTEFLFNHESLLDEATQLQIYQDLASVSVGKILTVRLFDLGGDKNLRPSGKPAEPNPALGERGIRLAHRDSKRLRTQLTALLQVNASPALRILVPMVTSAEELRDVHIHIARAREDLRQRQKSANQTLLLGAMLEVPSAAMSMDALAQECSFFSVGANDLLHYFFAIDRNNPRVSYLYRPHHPAACRLFQQIVADATRLNRPLQLCGEAAGDSRLTPLLLGLGFRTFCVDPKKTDELRDVIASVNLAKVRDLARHACAQTSPEGVARLFDLTLGSRER